MGNTVCVRIPGVQFEFKLHSSQDLIGHFQWSVSSVSKCMMQGSRRGREGEEEGGGKREEGQRGRTDGEERGGSAGGGEDGVGRGGNGGREAERGDLSGGI